MMIRELPNQWPDVSDYYENFLDLSFFLGRLMRINMMLSLGPLISNSKIRYYFSALLFGYKSKLYSNKF